MKGSGPVFGKRVAVAAAVLGVPGTVSRAQGPARAASATGLSPAC